MNTNQIQQEQINEFKKCLGPIDIQKWSEHAPVTPTDQTFLRFITFCGGNVRKAVGLYKSSLRWREHNNIQERYKEDIKKKFENFNFSRCCNLNHLDKLGIPVEIYIPRNLDLDNDEYEDVIDEIIMKEEILHHYYDINSKGIILIYDLRDFSLSNLFYTIAYLKKICEIMDTYYAGRCRKIHIVGIPSLFSTIYETIKYFLSQEIIDIIFIHPNEEIFIETITPELEDPITFKNYFIDY